MKKFALLLTAVSLTACSQTQYAPDQEALLQNPLYLEMYAENMVDTMVNLEIYEDPILEEEGKKAYVDNVKEQWLAKAKEARALQRQGSKGTMVPMKEYVEGEVLYVNGQLHLSPYFFTTPGPSLHVFLSKAVDPRDVLFPDETAIDLGQLTVPMAAQTFAVPATDKPAEYLSVTLWDTELNRLYGFAQIAPLY